MNVKAFLDSLEKDNFPPIVFVQGSEEYLHSLVKEKVTKLMLGDNKNEFNFGVFDMETTSLDQALEEAESLPFFDSYRLLMIENPYFLTGERSKADIDHDVDWLIEYIKNPADFTYLIIFAPYEKVDGRKKIVKTLKKEAVVIDANPPYENEIKDYVGSYLSEEGYKITPQGLERLLQLSDAQITKIMGELEKLKVYKIETKEITAEDVDALVPIQLEQNVFELNDLVLKRDVDGAITLFQDLLLQGEDPIKLIALMSSQFRILLQSKILKEKGYQQNEMAKVLKVHPYRIKIALQQVRYFPKHILSAAHRGLIDADYHIKSGKIDPEVQFELFVIQFSDKELQRNL